MNVLQQHPPKSRAINLTSDECGGQISITFLYSLSSTNGRIDNIGSLIEPFRRSDSNGCYLFTQFCRQIVHTTRSIVTRHRAQKHRHIGPYILFDDYAQIQLSFGGHHEFFAEYGIYENMSSCYGTIGSKSLRKIVN